jgi:hypothetical protein
MVPCSFGVGVVAVVVVVVLGAVIWGSLSSAVGLSPSLRKVFPASGEERFATEVLREFLLDVQRDPVSAPCLVLEPRLVQGSARTVGPVLAGVTGGGAGVLEDFYAKHADGKTGPNRRPATGTTDLRRYTSRAVRGFGESVRELVEGIRISPRLLSRPPWWVVAPSGTALPAAWRPSPVGWRALPIKDVLVSASRTAAPGPAPDRTTPQKTLHNAVSAA